MFDIAYECEVFIFISDEIFFNQFDYSLEEFIWSIDAYGFYSILLSTHGGV